MKLSINESMGQIKPLTYKGEFSQYVDNSWRKRINSFLISVNKLNTLLNNHPEIFTYTDAKVHEVAYEIGMDAEYIDDWLEFSWNNFKDYLESHNLKIVPLRRSNSKFTIVSDSYDNFLEDITNDFTIDSLIDELYETFCGTSSYSGCDWQYLTSDESFEDFLATSYIEDYEGSLNDDVDLLSTGVEDILSSSDIGYAESEDVDTIISEVQNIIDAYQSLEDFKANQVQNYRDYVSAINEI